MGKTNSCHKGLDRKTLYCNRLTMIHDFLS